MNRIGIRILCVIAFVVMMAGAVWRPGQVEAQSWYYASRIVPTTALPANCLPGNGDIRFLTVGAAPLAPAMYVCTAANTWTRLIPNSGVFLATGATTVATFTRTDAGHAHILITNTAGSSDWGIGAAGEAHIDVDAGHGIFMRQATLDMWHFRADYTLQSIGVDFAGLGAIAAPADGSIIYCSDCTIASPCAGVGTGAIAKRLNGAWVCN